MTRDEYNAALDRLADLIDQDHLTDAEEDEIDRLAGEVWGYEEVSA